MRYITREKILIFNKSNLVNFLDDFNAYYPFSIYKNLCVIWDDDFDHRVLDVIDNIPDFDQGELVAIHEHEGGLNLLWANNVPYGYKEGDSLDVPNDMDSWLIMKSITVFQLS